MLPVIRKVSHSFAMGLKIFFSVALYHSCPLGQGPGGGIYNFCNKDLSCKIPELK